MKTLYFEGAGTVPCGEVENCWIRTAFHTDVGKVIYLEILGHEVTKRARKLHAGFKNVGSVDHCHYITGDSQDCNNNRLPERHTTFEYTKKNILSLVNSLGCSFDQVVILPYLAGYRVFKDGGGCNYGDEFQFNAERTSRAQKIRQYFYNLEKSEGKQHPNFSLWVDQENPEVLHLLRRFNGYNKHWIIQNTDNWQDTVEETTLGKYAC